MGNTEVSKLIKGYTEWVQEYLNRGWKVYFLTFQFYELGRYKHATVLTMKTEVERFYRTSLTRINRWPGRESQREYLPLLIGVPDSPVFKRQSTATLAEISPNSGYHFHALFAIPRMSRLKTGLKKHVEQNQSKYLGYQGKVAKIHVKRVRQLQGRVVDYLFKHIKRRTFTLDDVLILPGSATEASQSHKQQRFGPKTGSIAGSEASGSRPEQASRAKESKLADPVIPGFATGTVAGKRRQGTVKRDVLTIKYPTAEYPERREIRIKNFQGNKQDAEQLAPVLLASLLDQCVRVIRAPRIVNRGIRRVRNYIIRHLVVPSPFDFKLAETCFSKASVVHVRVQGRWEYVIARARFRRLICRDLPFRRVLQDLRAADLLGKVPHDAELPEPLCRLRLISIKAAILQYSDDPSQPKPGGMFTAATNHR
jgi:hypothetical protein